MNKRSKWSGLNFKAMNQYWNGQFEAWILIAIVFQCHYSIAKGVAFLGIGTDNLIKVKCDAKGKMIPADLEQKIIEAKDMVCMLHIVSDLKWLGFSFSMVYPQQMS